MLSGGLTTILILLPNLLWMVFPPRGQSEGESTPQDRLHRVLETLEWVGRIAVFVIPFFYRIEVQDIRQVVALVVMSLALLLCRLGQVFRTWPEPRTAV